MSHDTRSDTVDLIPPDLRRALVDASIVPLWESPVAHSTAPVPPANGKAWHWADTRPIMLAVGEVSSPKVVERRVLQLIDADSGFLRGEGTSGAVNATLQMLKPGERARPHRHSMNALRFVVESSGGARTVVDGKICPMERGDLILTPAWCWHAHEHDGDAPVIWVDVLDVALHRFLETEKFQPGPISNAPTRLPDSAFAVANIIPITDTAAEAHSPVFRYPWADAVRAVSTAPIGENGARRVRYADPMTGGSSMPLLDSTLFQLDANTATLDERSSVSSVCVVVEGSGVTTIEGKEIHWAANDCFTLPANSWANHRAFGETARIFQASNAPVMQKLGLFYSELRDAK